MQSDLSFLTYNVDISLFVCIFCFLSYPFHMVLVCRLIELRFCQFSEVDSLLWYIKLCNTNSQKYSHDRG